MNEKKIEMRLVVPVLLSFFVMSFVDLVGIGKDRVAGDLELSDFILGLIPFAAFIWFFILSVPVGIIQARVGKKRMLNAGMIITGIGLFIPYFFYNFVTVIAGFALLGIGNTIVQVSANPLLVDVVPGRRASSFLSFSQFIKAIGSMLAAPLAAVFASRFGDWKLLFLVYGIISFLSVLWLGTVKIEETAASGTKASMASAFRLLGNSYILMMVLSIFLVVGIDVGFNYFSGKYLTARFGFEEVSAQSGRSVYFFGRMLGTFAGALILTKLSSTKGFLYSAILSIITILLIMIIPASKAAAWILVFLIGLGVANIFPLVFSLTVQKFPGRSNEISGLMMMAISGGALIPPVMGLVSDSLGVVPGMGVLLFCAAYLLIVSWIIIRKKMVNI
ncbi:MAG: MFS transporter [Bacteroidales bacterium]|jgi:fucose permease|nr:MFS transporter [Bacteroidales bacterium]MDX9927101.1 MFS transporter [Bacteroidales bacterium]HNX83480.1 MFS transporter [Bacteroidales bacterium]HPS97160.1 MFS transporter [Bacteroidales bacterium]